MNDAYHAIEREMQESIDKWDKRVWRRIIIALTVGIPVVTFLIAHFAPHL